MESQAIITVDARGLRCPLPVLRLRKSAEALADNALVDLIADDPAAAKDVPAFVREMGWTIEGTDIDGTPLRWRIRIRR